MGALDDAVARLEKSIPELIARATTAAPAPDKPDHATASLTELADQVDAVLAGDAPAPSPAVTAVPDPAAPVHDPDAGNLNPPA